METEAPLTDKPLRLADDFAQRSIADRTSDLTFPAGRMLLEIIAEPRRMADLTLAEWDGFLRMAMWTGLWPQLTMQARRLGLETELPHPILPHLQATANLAAACERSMNWERDRLGVALQNVGPPIILLKGAAYALCRFPFAEGRLSSDMDVLVPAAALPQVEAALMEHGWRADEENPLDAAYFRRWLHEIPPLHHETRGTLIDLHHTILPLTDRLRVNPQLLLDAAVPIANTPFSVLAPVDMVIHAATHLFRNGDFSLGLRGLCDLDGLLRIFGQTDRFWEDLLQRAPQLDLTIPCSHALPCAVRYLGTPIPREVLEQVELWRPGWPPPRVLDWLFERALIPRDPLERDPVRKLAIWWLQFWPPPRWRAVFSWLFWSKRIAGLNPFRPRQP
ncbi:MAG: nucleotidyltransferase family protein [Planctomycetaceae bacterium]|nr:nucleotidyltransferase family protein [Planctomycetaceae bacterium]